MKEEGQQREKMDIQQRRWKKENRLKKNEKDTDKILSAKEKE